VSDSAKTMPALDLARLKGINNISETPYIGKK
jgi:hypothetical protein